MQKVQKVSATASVSGSAGATPTTGRDRESGESYLTDRAHASGLPIFKMSTDDDDGTCCNSRQNGIVQPLLTGT